MRQVARNLGLTHALAQCFDDACQQVWVGHSVEQTLAQRLYGLALGYEDLNDHAQQRRDPLLAAPSTFNRLELSNSLDSEFCIRAWEGALATGRQPLISNTEQGAQFTSEAYLEAVESAGVDVSMDGRRRWMDNRFIERLWRSVKQEDIYRTMPMGGWPSGG